MKYKFNLWKYLALFEILSFDIQSVFGMNMDPTIVDSSSSDSVCMKDVDHHLEYQSYEDSNIDFIYERTKQIIDKFEVETFENMSSRDFWEARADINLALMDFDNLLIIDKKCELTDYCSRLKSLRNKSLKHLVKHLKPRMSHIDTVSLITLTDLLSDLYDYTKIDSYKLYKRDCDKYISNIETEIKKRFSETYKKIKEHKDISLFDLDEKIEILAKNNIPNIIKEMQYDSSVLKDKKETIINGIKNLSKESNYMDLAIGYRFLNHELCYNNAYDAIRKIVAPLVKELAYNESRKLFRSLNHKEEYVVNILKTALNLPQNTEVMIMDANSYINGLKLDESYKKRLIKLKDSGAELLNEFANDKNITFESEDFKNEMIGSIKDYVLKSQTYRDVIACYLAKTKSGLFIPEITSRIISNFKFSFLSGEESEITEENGTIKIILARNPTIENCFFSGATDETIRDIPTGISVLARNFDFLPHEIGHFIFPIEEFSNIVMYNEAKDKNHNGSFTELDSLCSKFTELEIDEHVFDKWANSAKEFLKKNPDINPRIGLDQFEIPHGNLSMAFGFNVSEFFQIMGITQLTYDGKNILLINKMSDMALSAELGLPIRMDHNGYDLNDFMQTLKGEGHLLSTWSFYNSDLQMCPNRPKKSDYINELNILYLLPPQEDGDVWEPEKQKPFVKFKPNLNAYGPMLELFGTSLGEYTSKIMFPYGLYSTLVPEYRLGTQHMLKDDEQSFEKKTND